MAKKSPRKKTPKRRALKDLPKGTHVWINPTTFFYLVVFPGATPPFQSEDIGKVEKKIDHWLEGEVQGDASSAEGALEDVAVYKVYEEQALDVEPETRVEVRIDD